MAHIEFEEDTWHRLGTLARNHDQLTAELILNVLDSWLEGQVFVSVEDDGPVTAQQMGHSGYVLCAEG